MSDFKITRAKTVWRYSLDSDPWRAETQRYAAQTFGHLMAYGETLTGPEFAARIDKHYNRGSGQCRILAVCRALEANPKAAGYLLELQNKKAAENG